MKTEAHQLYKDKMSNIPSLASLEVLNRLGAKKKKLVGAYYKKVKTKEDGYRLLSLVICGVIKT